MFAFAVLLTMLGVADSVPHPSAGSEQRRDVADAAVVLHRQPSIGVVSLRLAVLASDPPGYAGAGHMIQHLLYPALRDRAERVGGQFQIQRTSDAIVYTATGPAAELPYLAGLLRSTLRPSAPAADAVLRAERELREERLAEWETAPAHTRSMLRAQIFPSDLSAAGTDRAATRFSASSLPRAWAAMYRPDRVSVVAVGDVYLADVQNAFAALPEPEGNGELAIQRDSVVLGSLAPAQATRGWLGAAYLASDLEPAAVTVTTRLIGQLLRERVPSAQVEAEHWWTHHGQAVALVLALPGSDIEAGRRVLGTSVASLLDDLSEEDVTAAAETIRREMLFYARTPERMAEVIGQFVDREGDPNAAERFYSALDALEVDQVEEVLERLLERTPARIEIPPQVLRPRAG
jgi:hypothetical protein